MNAERTGRIWQPSPTWRAKFLGFGTAWWLLLAPMLCGVLPSSMRIGPIWVLSHAAVDGISLSHILLVLGFVLALWLQSSERQAVREGARWFLISFLLIPVLAVLGLFLPFLFGRGLPAWC